MARRGFTLIELLVVLVLLGIAASVAAPAMRPPDAARAARRLTAVYQVARREAVTRGVTVVAAVDAATGSYLILADLGPELPPDTLRAGELRLPAGTRLQSPAGSRAVVAFEPLGLARGDHLLFHSGDASYEVAVDPWTGATSVRRL